MAVANRKGPLMLRTTSRKRILSVAALASSLALVAGCGSSDGNGDGGSDNGNGNGAEGGYEGEINIWAGKNLPIIENFNPFTPAPLHGTEGAIFEPLMAYNKVGSGDPIPMLATDAEFNEDGTEFTITIREGVEWNDGEPFTTDDVVFSFTYDIAKPSYLESAEALDDSQVLLKFDSPQFTNEVALKHKLMIPEHVWSDIGTADAEGELDEEGEIDESLTFQNPDPVGTGPFVVENVADQAYTLVPNENYWDEGKPSLEKVTYIGVDDNQAGEDLLRQGRVDWVAMFIPDADAVTDGSPIDMINTPTDPTTIYTCSNADLGCEGPQTDPAVRQALNLAIDRGDIIDKAFVGHAIPGSPSLMLPERDDDWLPEGAPAAAPESADIEGAKAILEDAGYALNGDGIYEKDGVVVEMDLTSPSGWTDYNDAATLIEEQTMQAGIKVNSAQISQQEYDDARWAGEFELTLAGVVGSQVADPYQVFDEWVAGYSTAEVGEPVPPGAFGFTRYANDEVDAAIKEAATTVDVDEKKEAYGVVINALVEDLPYIPVVTNASMTFYNAEKFTGWPTEDDLYMYPPSWGAISSGVILGNLQTAN